ncbi:MAG: gamma-glutamylcyclotransferase, partial [Acetobacteraceae bacterium]
MRSIHHRGTVENPGLVLALDRAEGGRCTGVAFRVTSGHEAATLSALRERELVSSAYLEMTLPVVTEAGALEALAYVIDPDHEQYCQLDREEQAQIIAAAAGGRGRNRDYLWSTTAHLAELGIADPDLEWLAARVRVLA